MSSSSDLTEIKRYNYLSTVQYCFGPTGPNCDTVQKGLDSFDLTEAKRYHTVVATESLAGVGCTRKVNSYSDS